MEISYFKAHRLSGQEKRLGLGYLLFQALLLTRLLTGVNGLLPSPLPASVINFLYFALNLTAVIFIFRNYLRQQLHQLPEVAWTVIFVAIVGFFAYLLSTFLLGQVIFAIDPGFASINDRKVQSLVAENYGLMFFGTVFLVPVAEETLYRGLLFRGLYDRRPILAWVCSVAAFSAVHVLGYVGSASALTLVLCFVQYIPAGLCFAGAYRLSGSLVSPILIHAAVNCIGMMVLR